MFKFNAMNLIVEQILLLLMLTINVYKCDSIGLFNALNPSSDNQMNFLDDHGGGNSVLSSQSISIEPRQPKSVKKSLNSFKYSVDPKSPITHYKLGQISAVDIDRKGNIVIFHRGLHIWNVRSFDLYNRYLLGNEGPINVSTVIIIEPNTMSEVNTWGANLFYLPHGLTFDTKGNVWLTDVALHQVFRFPAEGSDKPTLTLGERFVPGSDKQHFCKPTSVAIDSRNGDFYVADGYCNSRIARFDSEGKFLNQWGQSDLTGENIMPNYFNIPHKVVLAEELNLICVADREHGRIQCFNPPNGQFAFSITHSEFSGRLFSISYSPYQGGVLYAVNGVFFTGSVKGFLFNLTTHELLTSFGNFTTPHDIVATRDAENVYVVEIGPNYLWRFVKEVPIDLTKSLQSPTKLIGNQEATDTKLATQLKDSTDALSTTKSRNFFLPKSPLIPSPLSSLSSTSVIIILLISTLILIILIAFLINRRRDYRSSSYSPLQEIKGWVTGYRSTKNELNLGRILADPKRSGFNKLAMDDSDNEAELINGEVHSESEVEEFNVSSVRKI